MEKYHNRVESDCNYIICIAYNKHLDNTGSAHHGHVLREAEYEI